MSDAFLFTSESVSEGHPDKISDQISDAILDAIIAEDPKARVACETMVKTGMVVVAGEITTSAWVDLEEGPRVMTNIVGCEPDSVRIGMPVQVVFEQHEDVYVPLFEPVPT